MKFLIDEQLSPQLAEYARSRGYHDSAHVRDRGMLGFKDPSIMPKILKEDWTFVTNNKWDFFPDLASRSTRPLYIGVPIHAGLVILTPPPNVPEYESIPTQLAYFKMAIDNIMGRAHFINSVLEIKDDPDNMGNVLVEFLTYPE